MTHEHEIVALVPDRFGLSIVDVAQLLDYVADGQSLEDAITNAAFDSVNIPQRATPEQKWETISHHIGRVRALNETGDSTAYWDAET